MERKTLADFTKIYQVSKTLRFELQPVGETGEHLKKNKLFDHDRMRNEAYPEVKKILDGEHKKLLERVFSTIDENVRKYISSAKENTVKKYRSILNEDDSINWCILEDAIKDFRAASKEEKSIKDELRKKLEEKLEKKQKSYRELLLEIIKADENYKILADTPTPKDLFKKMQKNTAHIPEALKTFSGFACYFNGYQKNRKNIYSAEAQNTAAPFRAVNDNFPKFVEMVRIFNLLKNEYPEIIADTEKELTELFALWNTDLNDIFQIKSYSRFLAQNDITALNIVLAINSACI